MKAKEIVKAFVRAKVRAIRRMLDQAIAAEPKPLLWNLKPEVAAAFEDACAQRGLPVKRLAIRKEFPSTSRGRGWFPRVNHAVLMKNQKTGALRYMPEKGYRMDEFGTIRKAVTA